MTARNIEPNKLIVSMAKELEDKIETPEWAYLVKTGVGRERHPTDEKWWYVRAASVLRKLYLNGPVGVSRLRSYYGNRHRRGHKPAHFAKAGGKIIRNVLQDLEKANLIKKTEKPEKGRAITPEGQKFVDSVMK